MENKKYLKYKLDRVITTDIVIEVDEDVNMVKVDNLIFPFMDVFGELEHLDWEPHYSQNTFSSEEIEFTDVEEFPDNEGEEFSKGKGNLYIVSSTDDDSLEILPK